MSTPGNEIDPEAVTAFETEPDRLRMLAETLLPASRSETEALVAAQLRGQSDKLTTCTTEYFTNTLPNGEAAYDKLIDLVRNRTVATPELFSAISTVQASLLAGEQSLDQEPPERAGAALARVVSMDTAALAPRLDGGATAAADARDSVEQLIDRATDIEESSFEIETLVEQQAENTDNIASEISDINAATEEIAATAQEVNEQSDRAQELTQEGYERAEEMTDRMERINDNATQVREQVATLQDRTDEIDDIVDVINDIADQTNMLALNASIEAARAGGDSEGFAVVADEVKNLAEESKTQAGEIEELVDSIQAGTEQAAAELDELEDETSDGYEASKEALDTFSDIEQLVTSVSTALDEVETATEEQSESAEELAMMIDEASRKAGRISEELSQIAQANETQRSELKTFAQSL
jgi:methyl-accepting chemotaxis protein